MKTGWSRDTKTLIWGWTLLLVGNLEAGCMAEGWMTPTWSVLVGALVAIVGFWTMPR